MQNEPERQLNKWSAITGMFSCIHSVTQWLIIRFELLHMGFIRYNYIKALCLKDRVLQFSVSQPLCRRTLVCRGKMPNFTNRHNVSLYLDLSWQQGDWQTGSVLYHWMATGSEPACGSTCCCPESRKIEATVSFWAHFDCVIFLRIAEDQ